MWTGKRIARSHVETVGLQRHLVGHPCTKFMSICELKPTAGIDEAPVKNSSISFGLIVNSPEIIISSDKFKHNEAIDLRF